MSQIKNRSAYICLLFVLFLSACGSGSGPGKAFVPESGHTGNWINPSSIGTADFHGSSVPIVYGEHPGAALFSIRCAACHGAKGSGSIGPGIQGKSPDNIKSAFKSVVYMRWLDRLSTGEEINSIANFLADTSIASSHTSDANVCSQCHGDLINGGISKTACYACHNGPDGTVGHPSGWLLKKSGPVRFHGNYASSFITACTTCHGPDLKGPVVPSCFKCHGSCGADNCAPLADAGPEQTVLPGTLVFLDGTGSSDVDGDSLIYSWAFTSKPTSSSAVLSSHAAAKPTFTADVTGDYVIKLVVNDGKAKSAPASVTVIASSSQVLSFSANIQPILNTNCIVCHSPGGIAGGFLLLTPDTAYEALVNKSSTKTNPADLLVKPFDSADSVLYQRISGIGLPTGKATMPLGGNMLSAADQDLIKSWIDAGAAQ